MNLGTEHHITPGLKWDDVDTLEIEIAYPNGWPPSAPLFVCSTDSINSNTPDYPIYTMMNHKQPQKSFPIFNSYADFGNYFVVEIVNKPTYNPQKQYIWFGAWSDAYWSSLAYWKNIKIYKDDVMIRNFIPCYRISDNEVGLYDLVERKFYANQGTETFIKGPDL